MALFADNKESTKRNIPHDMNYANTMALSTLNILAPFLNSIKQNWCIIGSTGLVLHGMDTHTEMIDVVTDEEGANTLARFLSNFKTNKRESQVDSTENFMDDELKTGLIDNNSEHSTENIGKIQGENISSNVSLYQIGGTTVRILSNMKVRVNEGWVKLLEIIRKKETFDFNGYRLILPSLADQLNISRLSGQKNDLETAEQISLYLAS